MHSLILCRYGELTIKGANRILFERCLTQNIRSLFARAGISATVTRKRGRTFVSVPQEAESSAITLLRRVFGLSSISPVHPTALDYTSIEQVAKILLEGKNFQTFAVRAQRLQKIFAPTPEIHRNLGRFIEQTFDRKVDLENPDIEFGIEIIDQAYLFTERLSCPGGLPYGIEGTVLAIVESPEDLLAAWLVMKRGCAIIPVQRTNFSTALLNDYGCTVQAIHIKHINEIGGLMERYHAVAVVAQEPISDVPVFRPLVGYSPAMLQQKVNALCTPLLPK
ncbi:MAG TPA: THUMP domain-containing protein [Candidatus Nanoarchaeia archaeon]|nr:THUMP domain-containing protein [Candidatus Nanoarchaeia archaeon]